MTIPSYEYDESIPRSSYPYEGRLSTYVAISILGREGARDNPRPYDNRVGRGKTCQRISCELGPDSSTPLGAQIVNYGETDMASQITWRGCKPIGQLFYFILRTGLLGKKVCFGTYQFNPNIGARVRN